MKTIFNKGLRRIIYKDGEILPQEIKKIDDDEIAKYLLDLFPNELILLEEKTKKKKEIKEEEIKEIKEEK